LYEQKLICLLLVLDPARRLHYLDVGWDEDRVKNGMKKMKQVVRWFTFFLYYFEVLSPLVY